MVEIARIRTASPPLEVGTGSGFAGVERRNRASRELLVRRVRNEFEEMPGLRLTFGQARLLFGLEPGCCVRILGVLAESGYLIRSKDGTYGRRDLVA